MAQTAPSTRNINKIGDEPLLEEGVAVSTCTVYQGTPPTTFIKTRTVEILKANPWLTSKWRGKNISYESEINMTIDDLSNNGTYFQETSLDLTSAFENYILLNETLAPLLACNGKVLKSKKPSPSGGIKTPFRVSIVNITHDTDKWALCVSVNHTLADGATFYRIYSMLNSSNPVVSLNPVRPASKAFRETQKKIVGKKEASIFSRTGVLLSVIAHMITDVMKGKKREVLFSGINNDYIENEKRKREANVQFISKNDVITCAILRDFFKPVVGMMEVNLRGRCAEFTNDHAGNYTVMLPLMKPDFASPSLIRKCYNDETIKRAGGGKMPGFSKMWRSKSSFAALTSEYFTFVFHFVVMSLSPPFSFSPPFHRQIGHLCMPTFSSKTVS